MTCPTHSPFHMAPNSTVLAPLPGKVIAKGPATVTTQLNRAPPTRRTTTDCSAKHAGCGNFSLLLSMHRERHQSDSRVCGSFSTPIGQQTALAAKKCGTRGRYFAALDRLARGNWPTTPGFLLASLECRLRGSRFAAGVAKPIALPAERSAHPPPRHWPCSSHQTARPAIGKINRVGPAAD